MKITHIHIEVLRTPGSHSTVALWKRADDGTPLAWSHTWVRTDWTDDLRAGMREAGLLRPILSGWADG